MSIYDHDLCAGALVGLAPIVRCRRRSPIPCSNLYPYQSTAKSPHDHVLSCTAHSTPFIVRMVYVISHFLAQYMQVVARGSCSELRPWWAAKIPHRPATAHPHAPGAGPKLGRRTRPARSQAARHPKQRKPRQTSPVTNLVHHKRLK